jgi:CHAT domain-containing protein/tetratricopeptide (TPR) repeat protein
MAPLMLMSAGMRMSTLRGALAAVVAVLLASCSVPPPDAYIAGGNAGGGETGGLALGKNATGEACTQQQSGDTAADVYCGTWTQPSARVRSAGPASAGTLNQLATTSAWRQGLEDRYTCGAASSTTILGGQPAMVMNCTQRLGGWPHLAMVASVDGKGWYADGVLPALPVMERSIGVLSGRVRAEAASQSVSSAADAQLASRLAAAAFSSGDVGAYENLIRDAARFNQAENFAGAETAYRTALELQEKALGRDNPNIVSTLLNLALQISNQGRWSDADGLFARADRLAAGAADNTQKARLLHYKALHLLNQGKREEALALLDQAEPAYAALLPPEVLNARPAPQRNSINRLGATGGASDMLGSRDLLTDVSTRSALMGLIEVRRYRAIVLRGLGRIPESEQALDSARQIAAANNLRTPVVRARIERTAAAMDASQDEPVRAAAAFGAAATAFATSLPDTRPVAETELLRAGQLLKAGRSEQALEVCQSGVKLLRQLKIGTESGLLDPCLDAYAQAAASRVKSGDNAAAQGLLVQMFEASQLSQGGVTSQQIAQATARLSANARDPKVAEAIRTRQDAVNHLADLYRERDRQEQLRTSGGAPTAANPEADAQITKAQADVAAADTALQAAAPNFGQLVQQVAAAKDVFDSLAPNEGFVSITLSDTGGWSFLLRDGQVSVAHIEGGTPRMAALVKKIRGSIESETGVPPAFDVADAHALFTATMGGLDAGMQGMTALVVAPSGPLLSVPFALLLTGPGDAANLPAAPWLLRRMSVAHVPAAANFVSLRKIAGGSRAQRPWFGFGDFQPVTLAQARKTYAGGCGDSATLFAGLPPLPYAIRELSAARQLLGASASDELLGRAFTSAAVLKTPLKNYQILHFATHALLPTDLHCQSESAIVTSAPQGAADASGALLTASEVTGLDLDANLVILSACNSGGPGGGTAGESLSGLARSFFYAGARALLVTHWEVNDQAAAYLVAVTLQKYRSDPALGIASALRTAQLAMLDDAGKGLPAEIAHPFYWAPFALIGDGSGKRVTAEAGIPPKG